MACCNSTCEAAYVAMMSDIPSKWAAQIASVLCQFERAPTSGVTCEDITACETLTAITDFSMSGNTLSISYQDENSDVNILTVPISLGNNIQNQFAGNQTADFWINGRARAGNLDVTTSVIPVNGLYMPTTNVLGIAANSGLVTTIDGNGLMTHAGNIFMSAAISSQPAISFFLNSLAGSDYFIQRRGTTLDFHGAGIAQISVSGGVAYTANANSNQGHEWFSMNGSNNDLMQLFPDGSLLLMTTNVQQNPDTSAILKIVSTTRGVRFPNMTTAQKNAIPSPAGGLVVYDITLQKLCVYTTAWQTITST